VTLDIYAHEYADRKRELVDAMRIPGVGETAETVGPRAAQANGA
jgi:hypothetical protein